MKSNVRGRIRLISYAIVVFAVLLVGRLYYVQIVHGETYAEQADHQYVRPSTELFDRGSIFFEDKDGRLIAAATVKSGFTITINPTKIIDPPELYRTLSYGSSFFPALK